MHLSQLHKEVERGEFSLRFVSSEGEVIDIERCVLTSWFSRGATMNIKVCVSGVIRTIRRVSIIAFNGREVYL